MSAREKVEAAPFAITGEYRFSPKHSPERIQVSRERNLDRTQNFCKGEDVSDNGTENREIHISGRMLGPEKDRFDQLLNADVTIDMTSATWSGEVRVASGEYEGPTGWHPPTGYYYYDYRLDLVSTGAESGDASSGNGIVSTGLPGVSSISEDEVQL